MQASSGTKYLYESYNQSKTGLAFSLMWNSEDRKFVDRWSSMVYPTSQTSVMTLDYCYPDFYRNANDELVPYCFPAVSYSEAGVSRGFNNGGGERALSTGGTLQWPVDSKDKIVKRLNAQGQEEWLVYSYDNHLEVYGLGGRIQSRQSAQGMKVVPSYAPGAQGINALTSLSDTFGRQLTLAYGVNGQLSSLINPAGGVTQFNWDESWANCPATYKGLKCRRLTSVQYPDGTVRKYHYNEAGHLQVGPDVVVNKGYITGITDERGLRLSDYYYDTDFKAISSGWGGLQYQLAYGTAGGTTVTDPIGAIRSYAFGTVAGKQRLLSQSQPGGSGCTASSNGFTYDDNGNVATETDFASRMKVYGYDLTRNLETARIEGLAAGSGVEAGATALPAGARKISTAWHPVWRLPTKIGEPKKVTWWVYNGQSDPTAGNAIAQCAPADGLLVDGSKIAVLCKKVEQASTDANGSRGLSPTLTGVARAWKYTYNKWGQVLTEDGPRTDVSDITTYEYYPSTTASWTMGDLSKSTNALGQVTQYTQYDKHGNVLELINPMGQTVRSTYSPRQWLTSTEVIEPGKTTGLKTVYAYDGVGQLTQVTNPDGSSQSYTYDTAQRLTQIVDSLGNKVVYTLDGLGNRLKEDYKDPSGVLKRRVTRVMDALGRVQSVTGAAQ